MPENNYLKVTHHELDPDSYILKNINKYPEDFSVDVYLKVLIKRLDLFWWHSKALKRIILLKTVKHGEQELQ